MTEPIHKQIGDYEIIRELGHGGMGQVFLVRNLISDRMEAMKILLPDLASQGELAARFMREIKLLASLDHPNIAALRTAFSANNELIMIMEYVEGDTLAHRLERGAFSPAEALNYIDQVLAALSYAHAKGIIHRDIKPANMMLTPAGVLKLMDFGIARSGTDFGLTVTGSTLGSLGYMSPEQIQAQTTDARSDLYSVGVSLYEMVTGQHMFSATSSFSMMEAHVKEKPRAPIEVHPSLPKPLSDAILMAVAKSPAERFQTADAFRNALAQIRQSVDAVSMSMTVGAATTSGASTPPPARVAELRQPTPVSQPAPAYVAPTPTPAPVSTGPSLQANAQSRRPYWILAAAVIIVLAGLAAALAYRSYKGSAASAPAMQSTGGGSSPPSAVNPQSPGPDQGASSTSVPAPQASAVTNETGNSATADRGRMSAPPPPPPVPNEDAERERAALEQQKKLLDEMEVESDHLDSRAAAVESSLDALEQQMHQSGLGLRGDMVAARSNMRTDMAKAKQALEGSDTERARRFLDQANAEISKLEAFLGRR